jgi:hypothetical protein
MAKYRGLRKTKNSKLRRAFCRKPREAYGKFYYYCPTFLTKREDLEEGAKVKLVDISELKGDRTVKIKTRDTDEIYEVFFSDLRE